MHKIKNQVIQRGSKLEIEGSEMPQYLAMDPNERSKNSTDVYCQPIYIQVYSKVEILCLFDLWCNM